MSKFSEDFKKDWNKKKWSIYGCLADFVFLFPVALLLPFKIWFWMLLYGIVSWYIGNSQAWNAVEQHSAEFNESMKDLRTSLEKVKDAIVK